MIVYFRRQMKNPFCSVAVSVFIQLLPFALFAQNSTDSIRVDDAADILNFLSSDQLKGRGNFTPELIDAGKFISDKFKEYGLQPFPGNLSFYQPFNASNSKNLNRDNLVWNGKTLDQSQFLYLTSEMMPETKTLIDFHVVEYNGAFTDSIYFAHWMDSTNTLILLKQIQSNHWQDSLGRFPLAASPPAKSILFVSSSESPEKVMITTNREYKKNILFNIIGVLPGSTKPNEIVIFSAHYDHLGLIPSPGDDIYNGANDDASGTTALLLLAKYFAMRNDNGRTLFFCAFAGEELGLLGSTFLASKLKPDHIQVMINIEMIGKTNVTGANSFFVTGARFSTVEKIMKRNLQSTSIKVFPDPETGHLFFRSDNFPFAQKGVPAHSIMCSDDNDECYHQPCDEARSIDIENMTRVVRAIALSSLSMIRGDDTPSRINGNQLR